MSSSSRTTSSTTPSHQPEDSVQSSFKSRSSPTTAEPHHVYTSAAVAADTDIFDNITVVPKKEDSSSPGSVPEKQHQQQYRRLGRPRTNMSSSRSGGRSGSDISGSRSGRSGRAGQQSVRQLIESLKTHRVNTLTELCRIERVAATCDSEEDARAFQEPMTAAWAYYVSSNQMLTELRGLTRDFPFCGDILTDAQGRVRNDPESNRSWNFAWLCLVKIRDDEMVTAYAASEAARPEMWGGRQPDTAEAEQLARCFEHAWTTAVENMLRHWTLTPTWY